MNLPRRGLVISGFCAVLCCSFGPTSLADEAGRLPRVVNGSFRLTVLRDSGSQLKRIDPSCAAKFAGNASQSSQTIAYDLNGKQNEKCILDIIAANAITQGDELVSNTDTNTSIRIKVTGVKGRSFSAVRISQNFGGSQSIIRYFAAAIVKDKSKRKFVYIIKLLPPSIKSEAQANAEFERISM